MLCVICGKNKAHSYKGRDFKLCADCIENAFSELFESLDTPRAKSAEPPDGAESGTCPHCGASLSSGTTTKDGVSKCPSCGGRVAWKDRHLTKRVPDAPLGCDHNVGYDVGVGLFYCTVCGETIRR